jgi:hypothetical protein
VLFDRVRDVVAFPEGQGEWLLHHHMLVFLRGPDGKRTVRVMVRADVHRVHIAVSQDALMIRGCIGPCEPRAQRAGALFIDIAKCMKADAVNPGKAHCVRFSHAAAADDGHPKEGRHCR